MKRTEAHEIYAAAGTYQFQDMDHLFRVIHTLATHGASDCTFQFKGKRPFTSAYKKLSKLGYGVYGSAGNGLNIDWS